MKAFGRMQPRSSLALTGRGVEGASAPTSRTDLAGKLTGELRLSRAEVTRDNPPPLLFAVVIAVVALDRLVSFGRWLKHPGGEASTCQACARPKRLVGASACLTAGAWTGTSGAVLASNSA